MIALNNRYDGFFDLETKRQHPKPTYKTCSPKPQPWTPTHTTGISVIDILFVAFRPDKGHFTKTISGIERLWQWEESWVVTRWQTRPVTLITKTVQLQIEPTSWAAMMATAASTQTNYSNVYLVLTNSPKSW